MARFRAEEVKNYGGQGGGGFLGLEDDGDVARVRFLYDSIDDVEGMSVHRVQLGVKKNGKPNYRYVNCPREYNDPVDDCPFCKNKMPVQAKLFIPVYDMKDKETKTWERGKTFFGKMSSICSRYPHPVAKVFEIERHGARGDQGTTYEVFPLDEGFDESLKVADFPPKTDVMGRLVLNKSKDDMEYYLQEGSFPPTDDDAQDEDNAPWEEQRPRRRGSEEVSERPRRRTPANGNREDAF